MILSEEQQYLICNYVFMASALPTYFFTRVAIRMITKLLSVILKTDIGFPSDPNNNIATIVCISLLWPIVAYVMLKTLHLT